MPSYTFENKKTGKVWTDIMTIDEMEKYLNKKFDLEKADSSVALLKYLRTKFDDDKLKNYKIDDIRKICVFKKGSNEKIDNLVKNIGDVIEYLDLIANSL